MNANPVRKSPRRGWTLFILCFGVFMIYLDGTIVNVALPDIQSGMNVGLKQLQWVVDAYAITFACLLLAAGSIGDAIGHKIVFMTGMLGFTISSVLCAISDSMDVLLIGRALQGIFGSLLIPVSLAVIRSLYEDPAARAKAIAVWTALGGVALAAGPVVGGWLVDTQGWQSIFWINVPVGVLVSIALVFTMKGSRPKKTTSIDFFGQLLFIVGIASLAFGLIEGNSYGWGDSWIVASFAVSAASLFIFVIWEWRHPHPLLPLAFFRDRIFVVVCLINFTGFFGLFSVIFLLTLYLQNINGLSAVDTGIRFLSLTASIMIASFLGSTLATRLAPKIMIPLGSVIAGAALIALTGIEADRGYATYWWALSLLGIGVSFAGTSATVSLMTSMSPERAGMASGVANTFRQISAVVGVALSGSLITNQIRPTSSASGNEHNRFGDAMSFIEGMHSALLVAAICCIAGALIAFAILNGLPSRQAAAVAADKP
ncbi:MFS transporter [Cohnella cholangitidis]|nr:MFS transporter [Cohnella cholangitidis]